MTELAEVAIIRVLLICSLCSACTSTMWSNELECRGAGSLSATDGNLSKKAVQCVYGLGRDALPELVRELWSEDPFHGTWCGSCGLISKTTPVEWEQPLQDSRENMVSEVALYLIEAILREDRYFAGLCRVYVDGKDALDQDAVTSRIQKLAEQLVKLEVDELQDLQLGDFRSLMDEQNLSFPGQCY